MKNTILFTIALLMAFSTSMVAQNGPMDFETGGIGADLTWRTGENGTNPAMEFVTNPSVLAPNTSATVAKFTALDAGADWALVVCEDFGTFTFDADNSEVKVMVYKTVISNVGLKFEGTGVAKEIQIANTKINEWEEMTFDFSSEIGKTFNLLVLIPDFAPRTEDHIVYWDNLTLGIQVTYTPLNAALIIATPNAASVEVSTDGTDVATFSQWVTQADLTTYETAVTTAQVVADDVNATQLEVDDAATVLETATTTFDAAKATGTMVATNYTLLNAAITTATANAGSIEVSTDGADVLTTSEWLMQADLTTYENAIATAQAVADDVDATQQEADDAVIALASATTTFDAEKASGTMVPPIITDGTFDDGANTWSLYTGNGGAVDFSASDANCTPVAAGAGNEWQLQLYQEGLILGNTKSYKITFDAYAAADRVITLSIEEASGSAAQAQYSLLGTTTDAIAREGESKWDIPLTTTTASYELNVTMAYDETGSNPKFAFLLAQTGEVVHIDNVSIVEYMGTPTEVTPSKTVIEPSVSPNPVISNLRVNLGEGQFNDFAVFNMSGQKVMSNLININNSELHLDMTNYASGVYMVQLNNESTSKMLRIIKK
ncbi:MAG: T9SS type A sorting domain-containing protein [Bacteroidales bacterium]|jgi:hypothetical protein|nr:T9SS type A sorting domain-containing protein [Bacteroidales bacterium]